MGDLQGFVVAMVQRSQERKRYSLVSIRDLHNQSIRTFNDNINIKTNAMLMKSGINCIKEQIIGGWVQWLYKLYIWTDIPNSTEFLVSSCLSLVWWG